MTKHPRPWSIRECEDGDFGDLTEFEVSDAEGRDLFCVRELTFAHDDVTGEEREARAGREDARVLVEFIVRMINGKEPE